MEMSNGFHIDRISVITSYAASHLGNLIGYKLQRVSIHACQYHVRNKTEIPHLEAINILCSTQLSMKFILLMNVKMSTIVDILSFISRINTPYEILKARNSYLFQHFSFYEELVFYAQLS